MLLCGREIVLMSFDGHELVRYSAHMSNSITVPSVHDSRLGGQLAHPRLCKTMAAVIIPLD